MVSNEAKKLMLKRECFAKFPYLIEITLASGSVYRYANSDTDIVFDDDGTEKTFSAGCFSIQPPNIQQNEIGNGTLSISAVDQVWIERIRTETKRAKIRFVGAIVYNDEDEVETVEAIDDTVYTLTQARWNDTTISWTMVFDEDLLINIPCDVATSQKVSGVY